MAKLDHSQLLLPLFILCTLGTAESASAVAHNSGSTNFIKASCSATRYPALCFQSLSGYAGSVRQSQRQLALAALSVSLSRARSASAFVGQMAKTKGIKGREYQAVRDCIDNMGDSVDRLSRSASELGQMGRAGGRDFAWHVSNVQTWVSGALTDESTCMDGFAERGMEGQAKAAIRSRITNVAQVTSNALALVNRFAARHRAGAASERP